jgi:hypothetical protein
MARWSERRVSTVAERRRVSRGGRRCTDEGWPVPPPLAACGRCRTGTADLLAATEPTKFTVTYRCRDCGYQFHRLALP